MPLLVLGLVEFVRGALVFSILPLYGQNVAGYSLGAIGTAISLHYLLDNLLRIPAGWLTDRFGGKWIMAGGIILSSLGVYLIALRINETMFMLGAALFGFGSSPLWPTVITGVAAKMSLRHLGEALSKVFIAWLVGAGLGPVAVNFLIGQSFTWAFLVLAGALFLALTLSVFGEFPRVQGKMPSLKGYLADLWEEILSLWVLYPGMFVQTMAVGVLMPVITIYAQTVFGLSTAQFNYLLIGGGAFTVLLLLPSGKLSDRLGVKGPLVTGFFAAAICLALLPLQRAVLPTLVVGAFLGSSYSLILPAWNGLQARVVSPEKRGTMWAIFMTIEGVGTATGAFIGGKVWEGFGHAAPFFVSAAVLAVMALFYSFNNLQKLIKAH